MTRKADLFQPLARAAIQFRPEYLDFERGIRVGNLDDNARITRILKLSLEHKHRQPFVTERWGRGVYWQWIAFLPRANRSAKPFSAHVSFGCSKYFVTVDTGEKLFKCGLQIERGFLKAPPEYRNCELQPDWDWHLLVHSLKRGSALEKELDRLVKREGFRLFAGSWEAEAHSYSRKDPPKTRELRRILEEARGDHWAGFQLYYPMRPQEVRAAGGPDLIDAMLAVFDEVTPAMNLCMQVQLQVHAPGPRAR